MSLSGLWLPDSAKPDLLCTLCGAGFYKDQTDRYERHLTRCAREHEEQIRTAGVRNQIGGIFEIEKDREEWLAKDDNREAVIEGRKRLYGRKGAF